MKKYLLTGLQMAALMRVRNWYHHVENYEVVTGIDNMLLMEGFNFLEDHLTTQAAAIILLRKRPKLGFEDAVIIRGIDLKNKFANEACVALAERVLQEAPLQQ